MDLIEIDRQLPTLLQQYPAIWNRSSRDFKNKVLKENSFKKVARELCISVALCKERYRSLREKFRKEKNREQEELRTGARECSEQWELFQPLSFLSDFILCRRKRITTLVPVCPKTELDSDIEEPISQIHDSASTSMSLPSPTPSLNLCSSPKVVDAEKIAAASAPNKKSAVFMDTHPPCEPKRQRLDETNQHLTTMIGTLAQAASAFKPTEPGNKRFLWLGKFIAETLESMNDLDAEELARDITRLAFEKKIKSLR